MSECRLGTPDLGVGVGLRVPHYGHVLAQRPPMDFFEVISENFMVDGGKPLYHLDRVREHYPVIQHGVSLNIGGPADLDWEYLKRLKALVERVKPAWLSDHFCWCGAGGSHLHDLLPLPYTEEAVVRVAERAKQVQDYLEVPFALENTSSYMAYTASTMTEWQFVSEIAERADIGLMFDVNNVYVSAYNHGFDPYDFIRSVPQDRIVQIHVAGHTNLGDYIIDTHKGEVIDPVWELYAATIEMAGSVPTLIEWDEEIPAWEVLSRQATRAREVRAAAMARRSAAIRAGQSPSLAGRSMRLEYVKPSPEGANGWLQGGPRELAALQPGTAAE